MLTSSTINGVDVTGHINVGFPFILTKLGKPKSDLDITSDDLLSEFLSDIQAGRTSKIRVVYLAKPKIALDSYLKKVHRFILTGGKKNNKHNEFGNIFTTYKILESLFRNYDENEDILNHHSKRVQIIKKLIDKVSSIKKSDTYTKDEIDETVKMLKTTFNALTRDEKLALEGSDISIKTLFDSFLANLLVVSNSDTQLD
jgi:hypothetical protein